MLSHRLKLCLFLNTNLRYNSKLNDVIIKLLAIHKLLKLIPVYRVPSVLLNNFFKLK